MHTLDEEWAETILLEIYFKTRNANQEEKPTSLILSGDFNCPVWGSNDIKLRIVEDASKLANSFQNHGIQDICLGKLQIFSLSATLTKFAYTGR